MMVFKYKYTTIFKLANCVHVSQLISYIIPSVTSTNNFFIFSFLWL